jgi:hypothetical protein
MALPLFLQSKMQPQQSGHPHQVAKTESNEILGALMALSQTGVNASLSERLVSNNASNYAFLNALLQQELQTRSLLSTQSQSENPEVSFLQSLLLQRSVSLEQTPVRLLPSNTNILFGLGRPTYNYADILSRDALSANDLLQILQQRQQYTPQPVLQPVLAIADAPPTLATNAVKEKRKGRAGRFPQKLYQMILDLEKQEGGADIASFLHNGRAFAILDPTEFVKSVMPKYFRMSRFSSFQRQLNLYEFQRITEGQNKGCYYHELFMKGRPDLCMTIKRNKIKSDNPSNKVGDPFGPMGPAQGASIPPQLSNLSIDQEHQASQSLSTTLYRLLPTAGHRNVQ